MESKINHENAFMWLLSGYVTGYLNRSFDRNFCVSFSKSTTPHAVAFRFLARPSKDPQDFDQDLPLRNFKTGTYASVVSSADDDRIAAQPSLPLKHSILRDGSELAYLVHQVAITDATVLLLGESGVGKSLIAREIQFRSLRTQQPWVEINCAAIPEQLIESELFGVERGAFSGATVSRKGRFEHAHGGTVFLDEVGLLSLNAQSKLLRVLQSGEMERLGSNSTIRCDIRVIAATNENLDALVKAGKFREDLYFRLNVFPIHIPALRERKHEMPSLMSAIIRRFCDKYRKNIYRCTQQAREVLLAYDWPGNIRELENAIHHALLVCRQQLIQPGDLHLVEMSAAVRQEIQAPLGLAASGGDLESALISLFEKNLDNLFDHIEECVFRTAYQFCHGNQLQTGRLLGISRNIVRARLEKIGELPPIGGYPVKPE